MAVDSLVDASLLNSNLTLVANAIRSKAGTVGQLAFPSGFVSAIASISGGGGGGTENEDALIMRTLSIYNNPRVSYIGEYAFYSNQSIKTASFQNCEVIYTGAFSYCKNLSSIDFPNCTSVDSYAFYYCSSLTAVNLPECLSVGCSAFAGCSSVLSIDLPKCTRIGSSAFYYCTKNENISIPNCTRIDDYAFYGCSKISSIDLPLCSYIGGAFPYCSILANVSMPVCTNVGGYAFANCWSLASISIPSCTCVGSSAFYSCKILSTIYIPECTEINTSAFYSCSSLLNISVSKCTYLGTTAFANCTSLSEAYFSVLGALPSYAFSGCSKLSMISVPACSYIRSYVFSWCTSLSTIYVGTDYSNVCVLSNSNAFYKTPLASLRGSIYVPSSLVTRYKSSTNWSYFSNIIFGYQSGPPPMPTIVSWSTGTDAEIAAMVNAADWGLIDLSSYWSIGDTRLVSLSYMDSMPTSRAYYVETHQSQTAQLTILDFNCTGFSVSGSKPHAIVGLKNALSNSGIMGGMSMGTGYAWGSCVRRSWCKEIFINAIPANILPIFKNFTWKLCSSPTDASLNTFEDMFAFAPEFCVLGETSYAHSEEASIYTQWSYYSISANRIKTSGYGGNDAGWWLGSPISDTYVGSYCYIRANGTPYRLDANMSTYLAPFGCI